MTDRSVWTAEAKIDLDLGQNCKQCLEHIFKLRDILEYAKKNKEIKTKHRRNGVNC